MADIKTAIKNTWANYTIWHSVTQNVSKFPPKKVSIRKHWDPNLSKKDISIIPT